MADSVTGNFFLVVEEHFLQREETKEVIYSMLEAV